MEQTTFDGRAFSSQLLAYSKVLSPTSFSSRWHAPEARVCGLSSRRTAQKETSPPSHMHSYLCIVMIDTWLLLLLCQYYQDSEEWATWKAGSSKGGTVVVNLVPRWIRHQATYYLKVLAKKHSLPEACPALMQSTYIQKSFAHLFPSQSEI